MKAKDITVIGLWAIVGLVVALAIGLPSQLGAVNEGGDGTIAVPTLKMGDINLSMMRAVDTPIKAGDKPSFVLVAENPTDQPRQAEVNVIMTSQRPGSVLSRMPVIPQETWRESRKLELKPHQTLRLTMTPDKAVQAGQEYAMTMAPATPEQAEPKAEANATTRPSKGALLRRTAIFGGVRALTFSIPADKTAVKAEAKSPAVQKASRMNNRAKVGKAAVAQRVQE